MKLGILLFFCTISGLGRAQNIDSTEIRFIEERAKDYFRNIYVEANFKDPYSYELLKIKLTPITLREKIDRDISIKKELYGDITPELLEETKIRYERYKREMDSLQSNYNKKGKGLSRFKQMEYDSAEGLYAQSLAAYTFRKDEYEKYVNQIAYYSSMDSDDTIDKSKVVEYFVDLDCYAANSYGNKVLGRYRFIISSDGTVNNDPIKTN